MISIKIKQTKAFMARLLTTELFDDFLLIEATIDTYNTFHIDGLIHREFYKSQDLSSQSDSQENVSASDIPCEKYSKWSAVRPIALDLIKGKRTPLGFKFILQLDEARKNSILERADFSLPYEQVNLGLNIRFSNSEVILTTGVSYDIFTLDKSAEKTWDEFIPSLLDTSHIDYEIM